MFQEKKEMFKVISPIDKRDGSKFWMSCGVGYRNKDQSINMYIDALPVAAGKDGRPLTLQLREVTEEELRERREKRERSSGGYSGGSHSGSGSGSSGSHSGSYSSRGTLRSSQFDPSEGDFTPGIPGGGGLDHLNAMRSGAGNAANANNDAPPF
jgi:hypothetical protein